MFRIEPALGSHPPKLSLFLGGKVRILRNRLLPLRKFSSADDDALLITMKLRFFFCLPRRYFLVGFKVWNLTSKIFPKLSLFHSTVHSSRIRRSLRALVVVIA